MLLAVPCNSRRNVIGQAATYMGKVCRQVGRSCSAVEWPWANLQASWQQVHKACAALLNGRAKCAGLHDMLIVEKCFVL